MGLPSVIINFKETGGTAIKRGERGIVALVLKDDVTEIEHHEVLTVADIHDTLNAFNKGQVELALMGYQTPPKKVLAIVMPQEETSYSEVMKYLEALRWDYLAIPQIEEENVSSIASWVKSLNETLDKKVKAVLPNCKGDHESIINFTSDNIITNTKAYTTAEYCSRIAGLLAGTPMTISATYAPLNEVVDFDRLTKTEIDVAINKGELVLYHDGEKVKVARAVNSFVTTTQDKGESFKKVKIVDAMHMIHDDVKKTAEDSYLGKYANSYDNKCLLVTAIQAYLDQLVLDGILDNSYDNKIHIDVESQRIYLKSIGVDVEALSEKEIKEYNTKDKVFLASNIKILDAIEDITLNINV
nr:phage tail sheath subtilisin-like domain-containing protein [uncultured Cellulosilyticum sp.]